MKTIHWTDSSDAVPDKEAKLTAELLLKLNTIVASNYLVVQYAQLMVLTGEIDGLQIIWDRQVIPVNEYGAIVNCPIGFCDHAGRVAGKILGLAVAKKRAARKAKHDL